MRDDEFYRLEDVKNQFLKYLDSFTREEIYNLMLLMLINPIEPPYFDTNNRRKYMMELNWSDIRIQIAKSNWSKYIHSFNDFKLYHYHIFYDYVTRVVQEIFYQPEDQPFTRLFGFKH